MMYEAILLFAVAFTATSLFQLAAGTGSLVGWRRVALQAYLVAVFAAYFMWCWLRGGQTLAMKSWRIRVVGSDGLPLKPSTALARFACAAFFVGAFLVAIAAAMRYGEPWLSLGLLSLSSIGLAWALVDRDRQFLHDRLAGSRLVLVESGRAGQRRNPSL